MQTSATLTKHSDWNRAITDLENYGAAICGPMIDRSQINSIIAGLPTLDNAGTRTLLDTTIGWQVATQTLKLIEPYFGPTCYPIRAILFDKSPTINWNLGFHQDTKIPVRAKHDVSGYTHWSVKEDIPHCRPPVEFLENMVAIRIALDDNDESNGPLIISPGTHKLGFIPADQTNTIVEANGKLAALANAGDAVLMKPLTLHASGKSTSERHRRVIHIEFATATLPYPLEPFFKSL